MKRNFLFIYALMLFALILSGCSTTKTRYINEQYPKGNKELSQAAYKECLKEVPDYITKAAKGTYAVVKNYVPGLNGGIGYFIDVPYTKCDSACQRARLEKRKFISDCMKKKGWASKTVD